MTTARCVFRIAGSVLALTVAMPSGSAEDHLTAGQKACSRVSQAEAATILGTPVAPGAETDLLSGGGMKSCRYLARSGATPGERFTPLAADAHNSALQSALVSAATRIAQD